MSDIIDIKVSDEAFSYLVLQRGALSDLSNDRAAWEGAYRESISSDYKSMVPWLPETCGAILDVGSGLGGINIPLSRHYASAPQIWLLDGESDKPVVQGHSTPFNSMEVAFAFLETNDVDMSGYFPWRTVAGQSGAFAKTPQSFDLIISLQAWCFHIPPMHYVPFVIKAGNPGATMILDVRRDYPDYFSDLRRYFTEVGVAVEGKKFRRMVYTNDR